jgi:hypothetical protein
LLLGACPMDDDDDDDDGAESANDDDGDDGAESADDDDGGSTEGGSTEGGTTDDGGSSEDESTGAATHTIEGVVKRTSPLARGEDGIGTLYVGAFAECDHMGQVVGFFALPDADMSVDGSEVPFTIQNITLETVYLASFLDDDLNADQAGPLPDAGDPVLADDVEDGELTCVEVNVATGSTGVVVELNMLED